MILFTKKPIGYKKKVKQRKIVKKIPHHPYIELNIMMIF